MNPIFCSALAGSLAVPYISWAWPKCGDLPDWRAFLRSRYKLLSLFGGAIFTLNAALIHESLKCVAVDVFCALSLVGVALDFERMEVRAPHLAKVIVATGIAGAALNAHPVLIGSLTSRLFFSIAGCIAAALIPFLTWVIASIRLRNANTEYRFDPPASVRISGLLIKSRVQRGEWEQESLAGQLIAPWDRIQISHDSGIEILSRARLKTGYQFASDHVHAISVPQDGVGLADVVFMTAYGAWLGPIAAPFAYIFSSFFGVAWAVILRQRKFPALPWIWLSSYVLILLHRGGVPILGLL